MSYITHLPPYASQMHDLLIQQTNAFFLNHRLRLMKHTLPLKLPEGVKDLEDLASRGREQPPFTSVYRHMCNLKERILSNWSYIETPANASHDERNRDMPFNLRPLTTQIHEQLELMARDLNDPEFTGILLTLHSSRFTQVGFPERQCLSKVVGGALVEGLSTNDRCIKAMWMHPDIPARSTRLILQAFIPRLLVEAFDFEVDAAPNAPPFKFIYAMHDDLDRWPRQAWLLMASSKKMALVRHYEPSTSPAYPVDLDFGTHTDEGVEPYFKQCQCKTEKQKKAAKAQGWLERLIGCTEQLMYSLLPKAEERLQLGLPPRIGWRDLVPTDIYEDVIEDVEMLTPGISSSSKAQKRESANLKCNYSTEEWCDLGKDDLIDISSDSEVYLRKSSAGRPSKSKKLKTEASLAAAVKAK